MMMKNLYKKSFITTFVLVALTAASSCSNLPGGGLKPKGLSGASGGSGTLGTSTTSFSISRVDITTPTGNGSTAALPVTVYLVSSGTASSNLSSVCTATSTLFGNPTPCYCQFSWTEINSSSGSTINIPRVVQTSLTAVQPLTATCTAPSEFTSSIPNGSVINVTVLPGSTNPNRFAIPAYAYSTGNTTGPGDFRDSQGASLANVLRYTCYDQRQRGMVIMNRVSSYTDQGSLGGGTRGYPIGNKFCLRKADGSAAPSSSTDCATLPSSDYTAQAYYYNLYIRESEAGDMTPGNGRFVCPTVKEALSNFGTTGTSGKYWPLDSTFALSLGQTATFTIGVEAISKTTPANGTDPSLVSTGCNGQSAAGGVSSGDSLITSCLGFAAPTNSDGSCPVLKDSNGANLPTFRLRRYIALYPPAFDTDGSAITEPQAVDSIYVIDRPVSTTDPNKSYTMLGAKPCPFAYFDNRKVTSATKTYRATNNALWTGKNVDGIAFPNVDCGMNGSGECANSSTTMSCAATLPLIDPTQSFFTATTIHASNPVGTGLFQGDSARSLKNVYVRPVTAWSPHYEEDITFMACAPLSNPLRDPPLHFAKVAGDNTKVTWCAEAYPTQNDNVAQLDDHVTPTDTSSAYTGNVAPFTSHIPKNSLTGCFNQSPSASGTFTRPTIPANYPAAGLANHTAMGWDSGRAATDTCDRTTTNVTTSSWSKFPLLAPAADVESAMQNDSSYACLVSFDSGTKMGKMSPSGGCCGLATSVQPGTAGAATAHLEPPNAPATTACQVPRY